ncbi:MAG: hypothetical protein H7Y16_09090 [Candidatus Parcubacteria bacterium]|nr:hypothetical protein [Burkholderiales bacterium]
MILARALRTLLAVALLFAWQNALIHPLEHVDPSGGFIHLAGAPIGGERGSTAPDPLCDAVAAVAACVHGHAGFAFPVPQGIEAFPAGPASEPRALPPPVYRSQAPPQYS